MKANTTNGVPYASAYGCLMQDTVATYSDIAQAVGVVSHYMFDHEKVHWEAVKCIFRYLKSTQRKCICYGQGALSLQESCDANNAGDLDTHNWVS